MKTEQEIIYKFYGKKLFSFFRQIPECRYQYLTDYQRSISEAEKTIPTFEEKIYKLIPPEKIFITRRKNQSYYTLKCELDNKCYINLSLYLNKTKIISVLESWVGKAHPVDFSLYYEKIVQIFKEIYDIYPSWRKNLELLLIKPHRQAKIKEMANVTIEPMLKNVFSGTDYKYNLLKNNNNITLQVKLKKKKMLEIRLDHKNFAQQIKSVPEYLEKISRLIDETPFAINIKTYNNNINWQEVK